MAEIHVKENESIDSALRRFKRSYLRSGVQLNRKMLSELAIHDKEAFAQLVEKAKAAL